MFEREAEKWADKMYPSDGQAQRYLLTGAKFCYNKAKEECEQENTELKVKVGLSIDCEKAHKNGELCLGYGGDEDEPCEQCKNCIKCECGYYQLGETAKDEQLTKAQEIIRKLSQLKHRADDPFTCDEYIKLIKEAEQFLKEAEK
jgi:hypothetical protein